MPGRWHKPRPDKGPQPECERVRAGASGCKRVREQFVPSTPSWGWPRSRHRQECRPLEALKVRIPLFSRSSVHNVALLSIIPSNGVYAWGFQGSLPP